MLTLTRQLVALDMLCLELADFTDQAPFDKMPGVAQGVTDKYLSLLQQFSILAQKLSETAADYSDYQFVNAVVKSGAVIQFKNKRMLLVYLKLIGYVIEFYQASERIAGIRDSHFDDNAEKRLHLLQTRAIKAKALFKTVVRALGKPDYQQFSQHLALPPSDWSWHVLRLETH
jgi:hypothetical protein